jgi:hypothetical protein
MEMLSLRALTRDKYDGKLIGRMRFNSQQEFSNVSSPSIRAPNGYGKLSFRRQRLSNHETIHPQHRFVGAHKRNRESMALWGLEWYIHLYYIPWIRKLVRWQ